MRRISLVLLLLYSLLDFCNPGVPGAVTFDGGQMESARAERYQPTMRQPAAPVPEMFGLRPLTLTPIVRMPTPVGPHPEHLSVHRPDASADPAPAPSADDH